MESLEWVRLVPAREFAVGWLAASLAWSTDEDRQGLCRVVRLSVDPVPGDWSSVVMTATDGFRLSRVEVVSRDDLDSETSRPPMSPLREELEGRPVVEVVDADGRLTDLCKWVERATRKTADDGTREGPQWLHLAARRQIDPFAPPLDESMASTVFEVEVPGRERVTCPTNEGLFPSSSALTKLVHGNQPAAHELVMFAADILATASAFVKRLGGLRVRVEPLGSGKEPSGVVYPRMVRVSCPDGGVLPAELLLMPMIPADEVAS